MTLAFHEFQKVMKIPCAIECKRIILINHQRERKLFRYITPSYDPHSSYQYFPAEYEPQYT